MNQKKSGHGKQSTKLFCTKENFLIQMYQVKNDIASAIFRRVVKVTKKALIQDWTVCSDPLSMENLFLDACKYLCRLTRPERRFGFSSWYLCFRPLKETCRAILGQVSEHPEVESLCHCRHCDQGCGQSCITSTSQSPEAVIRSSNVFKRRLRVIQDISQRNSLVWQKFQMVFFTWYWC